MEPPEYTLKHFREYIFFREMELSDVWARSDDPYQDKYLEGAMDALDDARKLLERRFPEVLD